MLLTGNGTDEYKSKIIKTAENFGLDNAIIFTGYVDPVEILNISDLMVLPSENEGFGIACIEAFALNVPVIRTKTGGFSDMKEVCIGVEYGDTDNLANSIYNTLINDNEVKNMVNKAFQYYEENLTSDKMSQEVIKAYDSSPHFVI